MPTEALKQVSRQGESHRLSGTRLCCSNCKNNRCWKSRVHALIKHHFIAATDHMRHWEHGPNKLPHCQVTQTFNLERPRSSTKHAAGGRGGWDRKGRDYKAGGLCDKKKKKAGSICMYLIGHISIYFHLPFSMVWGRNKSLETGREQSVGHTCTFNPGMGAQKAGCSLWVWGQLGLCRKFPDSQVCTAELCLKNKQTTTITNLTETERHCASLGVLE